MNTARTYKMKDVEMLLASKTVVQNLQENLEDLSVARSNWTPDYVTALSEKIDAAIENYLGLDKKKELHYGITQHTPSLHVPAHPKKRPSQHTSNFFVTLAKLDTDEL